MTTEQAQGEAGARRGDVRDEGCRRFPGRRRRPGRKLLEARLDAGMVGKFVPVVLDYANSKGGESIMNLMKGALPLP